MQIPIFDQNVTQPNVQGTPQMPTHDPVAQAGERLGQTIEGTSDMMFNLAREARIKADASVVMDAYVNFSKQVMALQTDAFSKKGKDALDYDGYVSKFNDSYAETKARLSPQQQYLFDSKTAHERVTFETGLIRHAHEQGEALNKENAKATVALEEQKLSIGYLDEDNYNTKNPESLINHLRASVADLMNIHGVRDNDPAFKEAINKATSKAYTDRVKLLMVERPSEANAFFKAHESEIEPHEREALGKAVAHLGDEQLGIGLAMGKIDDIKTGEKTETELTKEGYNKLKDNPTAFKIYQSELTHLFAQNHADQVNEAAVLGAKIETGIEKLEEKGRVVSLADLKNIPEAQELEKLAVTNKTAALELEKVKRYVSTQRRAQEEKAHKEVVESRAQATAARSAAASERAAGAAVKKEEREALEKKRDNWMRDTSDKETLIKKSETDIIEEGMAVGAKWREIEAIKKERIAAIKEASNPKIKHRVWTNQKIIDGIMDRTNIAGDERTNYAQAFKAEVKSEENILKRPLTDTEVEQVGIRGMQRVAKQYHMEFLGVKVGRTKTEKVWEGKSEEFKRRVSDLEKKRNTKFTPQQVQKLYEEYGKE